MDTTIFDDFLWSEKRKILTKEQMGINGLEMFGHDLSHKSAEALSYHSHYTMEFVYMVSGSQLYAIGDKEYTVKGNQVFMTRAGAVHGTGSSPHGRYEIFWFRLEEQPEGGFLNLDQCSGALLRDRLLHMESGLLVPDRNLKELISHSFDLLSREEELFRMEGCAMLVQFLCRLISCSAGSGALSEQIAAAAAYIDSRVKEPLTLETLAEISGLSLSRFKARFRQEVHITPREYINLKKIETAKKMLAETELSVTDIAFELSFSSSNYFAVLFRQIVGVSPSVYRKQFRDGMEQQR